MVYVAVFGIGSVAGMACMTLMVSLPFHFTSIRFDRVERGLQALTGVAGLMLGLWKVYEHTMI